MDENENRPRLTIGHLILLFAGVIMPAISVAVEATTHICAEKFIDPIPTTGHLLLVIFAPLAQLHVWFAIRQGVTSRPVFTGLVNAVAIGISLFYTVLYIPLLPLAAIALIFVIGLLPLAPLLSLIASIAMRFQLKRVASTAPHRSFALRKAGLFAGLGIAGVLIGALELPASITRYGLKMAASSSPETRAKGIRFLRDFGSREYLLRACYSRSGWADFAGLLFSLQDPVTPSEAQKIYYRVTGETFDTSAPPRRIGGRLIPEDEFNFDSEQGGVKIGGKLKGLSLASSKLDASADANGGVAYMQWTLVFMNESQQPREARAEVQLPPGAVVSRLTLWVNGEEREAAFAGRGKVRQAYQQVVNVQRRDPVLVTTAGRDRILVQCFPVPPGGEMKIRVGITVPLVLEDTNNVRLLLPHFVNRNFRIPDDVTHSVWIESQAPMVSSSRHFSAGLISSNTISLRGGIPETELSKPETSIKLMRPNVQTWSKDPFESGGFIIKQSIEARLPSHLYRIVLVVDTSGTMGEWVYHIVTAMRSIPAQFDVKLVLAEADGIENITASGIDEISTRLRSTRFIGGADNTAALEKAWDLAVEKPGNNAIVWVHSPQRLQLRSIEQLKQRWERRPYGPVLYSVRTTAGPDEVEKTLDGVAEVKSVPRMNYLQADLEKLFARLSGQAATLEFVRTSKKVKRHPDPSEAIQTSDHLARLWANDEVARILNARVESLNIAAITLATRYQLVTPVTGAVVLENAAHYSAAGRTPVEAKTVPTIPEPEIVALVLVLAIFLSWLIYRKYRAAGGGCPV